jgi:hypothetical protein
MTQRPALGVELPHHPAAWVAQRESRKTTAAEAGETLNPPPSETRPAAPRHGARTRK